MTEILSKIGAEALYHGNVDTKDAARAQDLILDILNSASGSGLPRKKYPPQHVVKVPPRDEPHVVCCPAKDPTEPNTAVEFYFQIGKDTIMDRVLTDVLSQIMYEPFYDQVRTKGML